jgi:DNA polymerase-4
MGRWVWVRSQGIDERPVEVERERKSLGKEDTFAIDILDLDVLMKELQALAKEVAEALQRRGLRGKTITVKCKYADFHQVTRSRSLSMSTDDASQIESVARELLRQTEAGQRKVRLLGVSITNFETPEELPLGLRA